MNCLRREGICYIENINNSQQEIRHMLVSCQNRKTGINLIIWNYLAIKTYVPLIEKRKHNGLIEVYIKQQENIFYFT